MIACVTPVLSAVMGNLTNIVIRLRWPTFCPDAVGRDLHHRQVWKNRESSTGTR